MADIGAKIMSKSATRSVDDKVAVDMTPMIDVVFQLLVFFALTLNVVEAEGDFRIRMPTFSQGTIWIEPRHLCMWNCGPTGPANCNRCC